MQGSKQHHTRSLGLSIGRWPNVTAFDVCLPRERQKGENQGRSVFIEKSWLIESLRSHFRKYEIVKGIACPGLHRQRRCDIIAR
jgi:hypothetical protein